jgi:hypothetical protein
LMQRVEGWRRVPEKGARAGAEVVMTLQCSWFGSKLLSTRCRKLDSSVRSHLTRFFSRHYRSHDLVTWHAPPEALPL